jgi:site-specific recombinase XerD
MMKSKNTFQGLLESYFTDRLMRQRQASPHTIASHRDTFRLLFGYAREKLKKEPSRLTIADLDAPFIGAFLDHLEKERHNSARSRNVRLAAIHTFFRYVALEDPASSALTQRVLAMPNKRYQRRPIEYLTRPEMDALLAAPDRKTWTSRRDWTMLLLASQTGLRVSELIGLRCQDVILATGAHVFCMGKGRKERCTPLRKDAVSALKLWLRERHGQALDPLFPNARGGALSRDGVEYLLAKHAEVARKHCPSLRDKRISPHVLRHSAAMELFQNGVDLAVIALWLGHESVDTTQVYLHADMQQKERALAKTKPAEVPPGRYKPEEELLAFLKNL